MVVEKVEIFEASQLSNLWGELVNAIVTEH